jgi:hypothetical protein
MTSFYSSEQHQSVCAGLKQSAWMTIVNSYAKCRVTPSIGVACLPMAIVPMLVYILNFFDFQKSFSMRV